MLVLRLKDKIYKYSSCAVGAMNRNTEYPYYMLCARRRGNRVCSPAFRRNRQFLLVGKFRLKQCRILCSASRVYFFRLKAGLQTRINYLITILNRWTKKI